MTDQWSVRLSEYIDGDLSADERAGMEQHLLECASCRQELAELREVVSWLKSDKEDEDVRQSSAVIPEQSRFKPTRAIPWAIAASVVLVAGSLLMRQLVDKPVVVNSRDDPMAMYHTAVADLERVLHTGRDKLDPETQRALESSIHLIDTAIKQSEAALAADTANDFVARHLDQLRQAKLSALRDAAVVVRAKSL